MARLVAACSQQCRLSRGGAISSSVQENAAHFLELYQQRPLGLFVCRHIAVLSRMDRKVCRELNTYSLEWPSYCSCLLTKKIPRVLFCCSVRQRHRHLLSQCPSVNILVFLCMKEVVSTPYLYPEKALQSGVWRLSPLRPHNEELLNKRAISLEGEPDMLCFCLFITLIRCVGAEQGIKTIIIRSWFKYCSGNSVTRVFI